jgi:hypothetical protein
MATATLPAPTTRELERLPAPAGTDPVAEPRPAATEPAKAVSEPPVFYGDTIALTFIVLCFVVFVLINLGGIVLKIFR